MKKVLLVTLQGDNIGNRLQNYALQKVLESLGCKVYTPVYYPKELDTRSKRIKCGVKTMFGLIGIKKYYNYKLNWYRRNKYQQFNKKYIRNTFRIEFQDMFGKDYSEYDYAITGSDQVWHGWSDSKFELPYFYLQFIPKEKRVAYAPSFGFDRFPDIDLETHIEGLKSIAHLSCREEKGKDLIHEITGREASVVVDPTMLLSRDDWIEIEKESSLYQGDDYVLVYFLGNNIEYIDEVKRFAQERKLVIIDIYDKKTIPSMSTTPDEFIWLIHRASYVFTDSFHATVFSILFDKKFLVFRRIESEMENMFDRIKHLLEIFGMNDRVSLGRLDSITEEQTKTDISMIIDYSIVYLRDSLNIN